MTETIDQAIREKIAELLAAVHTDAHVYGWNVLNHQLAEWPGLFRSPTVANRTHGWVVRRVLQTADRKTYHRDRIELEYEVLGFYGFRSGKAGDNSDEEFAVITAKTYNAINAEPRLTFENDVEKHDLLQYRQLTTIKCGEETLHLAQGRLKVHLCC